MNEDKILENLSYRQKEVLILLLEGYTREEIASKLKIDATTARKHVKSVYQTFKRHGYMFEDNYRKQAKLISLFRRTDFERKLICSVVP